MLTQRIEAIRQNYVNTKPQISCERAKIWTDSHRETEGQPVAIRRARAFYDCCDRLGVHIFAGELVVGAIGEFRKCGILTPEFSWMWVDREMDTFDTRPLDPYRMTDDQRAFVRREIFPYWKGKSLEEAFLARLPEEIHAAARDYDPSRINRYLVELAGEFHRFYSACRIKGETPALLAARLKLADSVRSVLANCLGLLGVTAPEKM